MGRKCAHVLIESKIISARISIQQGEVEDLGYRTTRTQMAYSFCAQSGFPEARYLRPSMFFPIDHFSVPFLFGTSAFRFLFLQSPPSMESPI